MKLIKRLGPVRIQAIKITALGGAFWFAWAFSCYQGVYLQKNGFSPSQMGMLNAISAAVAIASVAFWGMMSDRIGSIKKVVFTVLIFGMGLFALVPLIPTGKSYTHVLFLTLLPALNFFRASMAPMHDNLEVRSCNEMRLNFGMVRAFGSLCFTIGSLIISALLVNTLDVSSTFWISFLLMIPAIVLTLFIKDPSSPKKIESKDNTKKREKLDVSPLLKNKKYIAFLIFGFIFYIGTNSGGSFIPYYMESIGVNSDRYGLFLAYRALMEIPFLLLMNKLRRHFKLEHLLMVGTVLMGLESFFFSIFARSLFGLLASTTFFGLGNGLFIGSSLNYVYELAPDNLKATAQSFYTAVASVAGIVGNLLGGVVFAAVGATNFYMIVFLVYMTSATVFFLSNKSKKKEVAVTEQT